MFREHNLDERLERRISSHGAYGVQPQRCNVKTHNIRCDGTRWTRERPKALEQLMGVIPMTELKIDIREDARRDDMQESLTRCTERK